eukprot:11522093-Karenia_brevis.AAC.1
MTAIFNKNWHSFRFATWSFHRQTEFKINKTTHYVFAEKPRILIKGQALQSSNSSITGNFVHHEVAHVTLGRNVCQHSTDFVWR